MKKKVFTLKGRSKLGLESTVIQVKNKTINILRLGSITEEEIKKKFKKIKIKKIPYTKLSPGNQKKHYSPNLPIRINVKKVKNDEVLLNFGKNKLSSKIFGLNLSESGSLVEASRNFFHYLHILDKCKCKGIAVATIPLKGLGKTINDIDLERMRVKVKGLRRDGKEVKDPDKDATLQAHDVLVIAGKPRRVERAERKLLEGV